MFEKTHVRLTHKLISSQYGGGQTGTISHVISDYSGDLVPITPSNEPTRLVCDCGDSYMLQLRSRAEWRQLFWQRFKRRLLIFTAAHASASFGAFLAFDTNHMLLLRVIGFVLFVPSLPVSIVMFFRLLFSWPKTYSFEQINGDPLSVGSLRALHGVKFS